MVVEEHGFALFAVRLLAVGLCPPPRSARASW
jgi:hypothetical protein